ncbi:MAG TPA: histidine phosphatase family protein [Candidatus Obscuribacterales bacterium]
MEALVTSRASEDVAKQRDVQSAASQKEVLHPEEKITTLLLIRHGHTQATEEGRLYNDPRAELTNEGIRQAHALARWVKEKNPDRLLSSTAKRVVSTAEIIAREIGLVAEPVEGLNEWDVGDWEGRTYLDIKKNDPAIYAHWSADPILNRPPGGESVADMVERIRKRLNELLIEHDGRTIALVTHAGIVRSVIIHALDMPVQNFWRISIPVGSVSRVDFSKTFATVHFIATQPALDGE